MLTFRDQYKTKIIGKQANLNIQTYQM